MRYEETIRIGRELDQRTWSYLRSARAETRQDEDETVSVTATFKNGYQMDVKCCGTQDESSWTEAVLFDKNGTELCFTEPDETFTGDWELEFEGDTYVAHVVTDGAPNNRRLSVVDVGDEYAILECTNSHVDDGNIVDMLKEAATAYYAQHPDEFTKLGQNVTIDTILDALEDEDTEPFGFRILSTDFCPNRVDPEASIVDPGDVPDEEE